MLIRSIVRAAAVLLLVAIVTPVRADGMHSFGRWAGIGWGDGYHSHYACPPRHSGPKHIDQKLPWWATPATDPESLPPPAGPTPGSSPNTFPLPGQSLFRQPGEGSSVIISDSPR